MSYSRRVYVATAQPNKSVVCKVANALPDGWVLSYDWTTHTTDDDPKDVCYGDFIGVLEADVFILVAPGRKGAHFEFGLACGRYLNGHRPRAIIIVGGMRGGEVEDWPQCPFYLLDFVYNVETIDEAIAIVWRM